MIHILGVNPDEQGKGLGKRMINEAVTLSKTKGKLACRLDVLGSNVPAQNCMKLKTLCVGKQHWYTDNTGWTDFCLYEYVINV